MLTSSPAAGARSARRRSPSGTRTAIHSRGVIHGLLVGLLGAACSSAPPYSGWTAEQLYEHGQRALDEGDWGEARRAFERLVLTFPRFDHAVDARYYLAQATYQERDYLGAIAEFRRLVDVYPDHERATGAWMGLCRANAALSPHTQRDQAYTRQAQRTCANIARDLSGTPVGDSAAAVANQMNDELAQRIYDESFFYFRRKLFESAELGFLDVICFYPNSASAPRAVERLVDTYEEWRYDEPREEIRARFQYTCPGATEPAYLAIPAADTVSLVRSRAPPAR